MSEYTNWIEENDIDTDHLFGEIEELDGSKCDECKEHSWVITYKDKNYCNWYCAKKVK